MQQRKQRFVRRFWNGAEDQIGQLVHKPGGAERAHWIFDYNPNRADDDEAGYRFGAHMFVPGEYVVLVTDDDDEIHNFRVISVDPP